MKLQQLTALLLAGFLVAASVGAKLKRDTDELEAEAMGNEEVGINVFDEDSRRRPEH